MSFKRQEMIEEAKRKFIERIDAKIDALRKESGGDSETEMQISGLVMAIEMLDEDKETS